MYILMNYIRERESEGRERRKSAGARIWKRWPYAGLRSLELT